MPRYLREGLKRGWVADGYDGLFSIDLDELLRSYDSTIIKDQKRIKVCRVCWNGEDIYIKRYNPYSIWYRIEGALSGSKAMRAWEGAILLKQKGIMTAEQLAAIEQRRFGFVGNCFYITKAIKDSFISVDYFKERFIENKASILEKRAFLRSLAGLFRDIHEKGVYHNDLKDYNILVRVEGGALSFFLLDLEGIRCYKKIPERKRIKNLVQLNRTLGRFLTNPDKTAFIKTYSRTDSWKELAFLIIRETEEVNRKKVRD